jgi:hypothetical protein
VLREDTVAMARLNRWFADLPWRGMPTIEMFQVVQYRMRKSDEDQPRTTNSKGDRVQEESAWNPARQLSIDTVLDVTSPVSKKAGKHS